MQMIGTDIHDNSTPAVAVDMRPVAVETPTVVVGIFLPCLTVRLTLAARRIIGTSFKTALGWEMLL